jgi:hypothetical protein
MTLSTCIYAAACLPQVGDWAAERRRTAIAPLDLISISTAKVRRLLVRLVWRTPPSVRRVLSWSRWRRPDQARAPLSLAPAASRA